MEIAQWGQNLQVLGVIFMRFLALQKRNKRFIYGRFQPFLLGKAHGNCATYV
jgi:hypothetical protein